MTRKQAVETLRALQENISEDSAPKAVQALKFAIKVIHRFDYHAQHLNAERARLKQYGHVDECQCPVCTKSRKILGRLEELKNYTFGAGF